MRTLLICTPSHALFGGVENIVNDLCKELPARGWDTLLALGKGSRFNNVDAYRHRYENLPIVEVDGTAGTRQGRRENLRRVIRNVKPDVVLSARIYDAYEVVSELKQKDRAPRLAATIQAYEPHYIYDARLYRDCLDLCVSSGNMIREALIALSELCRDRVVSISGGVKPPAKPVAPREQRKPIRIGYVGRLEQQQKRIFDLVSLMGELDTRGIDYKLDIVGAGPDEEVLRQRSSPWVSRCKATFHGWQTHDALYDRFFPQMDCFIHFAHTEGVTIAPREAMAHGVVPVISEFTGLRAEGQFVDGLNSLVFTVGDVESAAVRIQRLVSEHGLLGRLSANAMRSQTGKYSFLGSMDAWAKALDDCLERPPMMGEVPKLGVPPDGRLTRLGLTPKTAQRIRDWLGRKHIHADAGSEWPTGSGTMTPDAAKEILDFAFEWEQRAVPAQS